MFKGMCKLLLVSEQDTVSDRNTTEVKLEGDAQSAIREVSSTPTHYGSDVHGTTSEWKLLAEVVQRICFFVFVVINIVVVIVMFIRFYFFN